uniref:Uncharacterized protein n=1 Tax=Panagrolaimus sp. PS1159 TaxID=55785 RepID=A0AC35FDK7_9BILA
MNRNLANPAKEEENSSMDFLNSIIADQQKKLQKYENFLESIGQRLPSLTAVPSEHAPVSQPVKVAPKTFVAPPNREYCDICEEFVHDTKVCPNRPMDQPSFIPIMKPRAFCEECDMFVEEKCALHSNC